MLVGVGAALFVIAGTYSWSGLAFGNRVGVMLDPSRVIAYGWEDDVLEALERLSEARGVEAASLAG